VPDDVATESGSRAILAPEAMEALAPPNAGKCASKMWSGSRDRWAPAVIIGGADPGAQGQATQLTSFDEARDEFTTELSSCSCCRSAKEVSQAARYGSEPTTFYKLLTSTLNGRVQD